MLKHRMNSAFLIDPASHAPAAAAAAASAKSTTMQYNQCEMTVTILIEPVHVLEMSGVQDKHQQFRKIREKETILVHDITSCVWPLWSTCMSYPFCTGQNRKLSAHAELWTILSAFCGILQP